MTIPVLDWSPERRLMHKAWTDVESMRVVADLLLERGVVTAAGEEYAENHARAYYNMDPKDWALFDLEARVRSNLLSDHSHLELRVTGGWPEIFFVVVSHGLLVDDVDPINRRVSVFDAPVEGVRRLLRR